MDRWKSKILSEVTHNPNTVPCRKCSGCMPCPYGLDIPALFAFLKWYGSQDPKPSAAETVARYRKAVPEPHNAEHCTGCRACKENCPQEIDIPKELAVMDKWIEGLKNEMV